MMVITMASYAITHCNTTSGGAREAAWANDFLIGSFPFLKIEWVNFSFLTFYDPVSWNIVFRFITEVSLDAGPFRPWKACVRGAVRDKLLKSSVWPCDSPVHCPSLEFWLPSVDNLVIWIFLTFPGKAWRNVKPFSAHLSIL